MTTEATSRNAIERRCTVVGLVTDALMAVLKTVTGFVGHSSALLADGVHSLGDMATDVAVMAMVGVSNRRASDNYRYGYGKFETLTAFVICVVLVVVAVTIMVGAASSVWDALHGATLPFPSRVVLPVAVVAVVAKESMYHYARRVGRSIDSAALSAYAWHHRVDALSTLATLVGVACSIFLGPRWRVLDPLVALLVSVLIIVAAYRVGRPAIEELLEKSLPDDVVGRIGDTVSNVHGVCAFHNLRTRRNGAVNVVDIHVKVDGSLTVEQSHHITRDIERQLAALLGKVLVNIHVEPFHGQNDCERLGTH